MKAAFLDTYAMYEILFANPSYAAYVNGAKVITTRMNLLELYYGMLAKQGKEAAEKAHDAFRMLAVEIEDEDVRTAAHVRYLYRKKKMSFVDALGYAIAKRYDLPFLTGNKEFRNLENVEFVK